MLYVLAGTLVNVTVLPLLIVEVNEVAVVPSYNVTFIPLFE